MVFKRGSLGGSEGRTEKGAGGGWLFEDETPNPTGIFKFKSSIPIWSFAKKTRFVGEKKIST